MSTTAKLMLSNGSIGCDATKDQRTIGSLQYLSLTQPDIGFVMNQLAKFMHKPTVSHWQVVKFLLWYIKHIHFGILLHPQTTHILHGHSNADWGGDLDDHKSTTAYVIFLGANPISWRT